MLLTSKMKELFDASKGNFGAAKARYLYVSFVGALVSVHTLHGGFCALHQVDAEERPPSHRILHTGVMRW